MLITALKTKGYYKNLIHILHFWVETEEIAK